MQKQQKDILQNGMPTLQGLFKYGSSVDMGDVFRHANNKEDFILQVDFYIGPKNNLEIIENSISVDYDSSDDNSIFVGLESPYNNGVELLELCDIKIGLATLADSVFYGKVLEETQDGLYLFKTKKSAPVLVEKGSLRPCIKASKHQKIEKNTFIIFPYGPNKRLLSESEFSASFPRAYNYLSSKKERLLARDKGKIDPSKWYAYGRTQGLLNDTEKILIAPFQKGKKRINNG
jgi:hypothetical protein